MSTLQSVRRCLARAFSPPDTSAKQATFRLVSAFAARLNQHSLASSGHDDEAARWAQDTLKAVLQVVDLRTKVLLSAQNFPLFSRARAVLGIAASQRLLTDSPEMLALMAWRFGLTSDVQALLANTHVYGLLEAIREFEPVAARAWVRAQDHYYRAQVSHLSGWNSLRNQLLAEQQADPQFDVQHLSPALDPGDLLTERPLGPSPLAPIDEAAPPPVQPSGRVRIPDGMRDTFLAQLPHTAQICVDFSPVD